MSANDTIVKPKPKLKKSEIVVDSSQLGRRIYYIR